MISTRSLYRSGPWRRAGLARVDGTRLSGAAGRALVAAAVGGHRDTSNASQALGLPLLHRKGAHISALPERFLLGLGLRLLVRWRRLQRRLGTPQVLDLLSAMLVADLDVLSDKVAAGLDLQEVSLDSCPLRTCLLVILLRL